jgi:hypothetical protein
MCAAKRSLPDGDDEFIVNPATGRKVRKTGAIGKRLMKNMEQDADVPISLAMPCIHSDDQQDQACNKCQSSPELAFCDICQHVGPLDVMKRKHAETHQVAHEIPSLSPNACECGATFHKTSEHDPARDHQRAPVMARNPDYDIWSQQNAAAMQAHQRAIAQG